MPTSRIHHLIAVGQMVTVGLAATSGVASAPATGPPLAAGSAQAGRIAFTSFRNGNFDLYVMNADGSKQRKLTTPAFGFPPPVWSPDGRRIAFVSGRGPCIETNHLRGLPDGTSDIDISVANVDGSGLRTVTSGPGVDCAPVWSPDGEKIAFTRSLVLREGNKVVGVDFDVYVINADGSEERQLTRDAQSFGPIWSPDGRKIAFWSGPDGNGGVYVMNADGSKRRLLTDGGAALRHQIGRNLSHVAWSPDGRKMLLVRTGLSQGGTAGGGRKHYIVVINADGSGLRRLRRFDPGNGGEPSWSPDGQKIAFTTKREGNFEIYVMNADGSGPRNLTRNPAVDRYPVWSPG